MTLKIKLNKLKHLSINPKEKLYLDVASLAQRALRALGMNNDGKERRTEDDTLDEFMKAMKEGDE